jgi:hypothetical protein
MRSALICCFVICLVNGARASDIKLERATKDYLENVWSFDADALDNAEVAESLGGEPTYEFEFLRTGGIMRYADAVDIDEWRQILSASQERDKLRLRVRRKDGEVETLGFEFIPPRTLVALDNPGLPVRLNKTSITEPPERAKLSLATINFFSHIPPAYAAFTRKPWAKSADEACGRMPNALSYVQFNLVAPSGFWILRDESLGNDDWNIQAIDEDALSKTLTMRLRRVKSGETETIHIERIGLDKIRIPEWDQEYFRCTQRPSR